MNQTDVNYFFQLSLSTHTANANQCLILTLFFPMFLLDPPENIRKPLVFCFQGDQKGTLGKKGLIHLMPVLLSHRNQTIEALA